MCYKSVFMRGRPPFAAKRAGPGKLSDSGNVDFTPFTFGCMYLCVSVCVFPMVQPDDANPLPPLGIFSFQPGGKRIAANKKWK